MAERIIIPRMGQTMTEGTVAKWYVSDGDQVKAGDGIYELEYDKSTATIETKSAGTVRLLCNEGDVISLGQAVAVVLAEGESLDSVNIGGDHQVANSAKEVKKADVKPEEIKPPKTAKADSDADIIVIGGGPGGYVAALEAAIIGAKVILIEKDKLGGTCLNRGCIPTKAILHCSEVYELAKNGDQFGVGTAEVTLDTVKANAYKDSVVKKLVGGVEALCKGRKVQVERGTASFESAKTIAVKAADGSVKKFTAENIIIAAGSEPSKPPIPGIDGEGVISSTEALNIEKLPKSMVVIGGGVIGMEIGAAYSNYGVEITVIEALDRILPNMDEEISAEYLKTAKRKMDIHTSARVESIEGAAGKKVVVYKENGESKKVEAETVLVCIGRRPNTEELALDKAGIASERGRVTVDENYATNVEGVFCIGDANGKCMLAHAASAQGITVVKRILGEKANINLKLVPSCIYTDPEIAAVGMTEAQAREAGYAVKVGKFGLRGNGRSLVLDKAQGFVKIIGDEKTNEILGIHIIGPYATEMIASGTMAMKLEGCVEDIANTIHAHPTVSESIMEAAENYLGASIHSM